jgi:3-phosphoglycerate kinase
MKTLSSAPLADIKNKKCLLRLDLNVEKGDRKNSLRIMRSISTLKHLIKAKSTILIVSHLGRPAPVPYAQIGEAKNFRVPADMSLKPFAKILEAEAGRKVAFIPHFDFAKVREMMDANPGGIFLMENIRCIEEEEKNSPAFSRMLADCADFYVNDAFSVSHRAHASVEGVAHLLPSYAGFELESEIKALDAALHNPQKPCVLAMGGAKISDKLPVMQAFAQIADHILAGGGVANTIFAARGIPVGDSLYEKEIAPDALKGLEQLIIPCDTAFERRKILDIGPQTAELYSSIIESAGTVIWNGPMGLTEKEKFCAGSSALYRAMKKSKAFCVIGGGETTSFILKHFPEAAKGSPRIFLSIGGGAMLEYLAGKALPGIEVLR